MIWTFASQVPRTITVEAASAGNSGHALTARFYQNGVQLSTVPALLHVCKEARKIAKKDYYLANGKPSLHFDVAFSKPFFFNWKTDMLYCPTANDQLAFLYNLTDSRSPFSKLSGALDARYNLKHVMLGGDYASMPLIHCFQ